MKTRATIIVAGDVQEVGFRAFAMKLGQKMKFTGYAENKFDGTVQVVCEGEKGVIEEYIKKLKANDGSAKVENIDAEYSETSGEFKGFRVKIDDQGSEMFQGFATAGRLLTELKGEMSATRKDIKEGNTELKEEVKQVGNKVDNMADRMDGNFTKMEQKYHTILEAMLRMMNELQQSRIESTKALDNLTKVVQTFVEMQKKQ